MGKSPWIRLLEGLLLISMSDEVNNKFSTHCTSLNSHGKHACTFTHVVVGDVLVKPIVLSPMIRGILYKEKRYNQMHF